MTSKLTSVFSTLLVLLLASTLSACKPAKNDQEKKAIADPNVVELTPALQEKIQLVKVGEAEIREVLRMPGSIQVDEQRVARIGAPVVRSWTVARVPSGRSGTNASGGVDSGALSGRFAIGRYPVRIGITFPPSRHASS